MKSANKFSKIRKITSLVLCLVMVMGSITGFGGTLKSCEVKGAALASAKSTIISNDDYSIATTTYYGQSGWKNNSTYINGSIYVNGNYSDNYGFYIKEKNNCTETFLVQSEQYVLDKVTVNGTTKNISLFDDPSRYECKIDLKNNDSVNFYFTTYSTTIGEKYNFSANLFDFEPDYTWNNNYDLKFGGSLKDTYAYNNCDGRVEFESMDHGYAWQGIVKNNLKNGFPEFTMSSKDLLNPYADFSGKTIYYPSDSSSRQVGVEFVKDKYGYYVLDSDFFKYVYNPDSEKIENRGLIKEGARKGFWPLGDDNFYFGMNFNVNFIISENGLTDGRDTVFEFSGDDDVWVFIDGKLVLDMGGIHQLVDGSMNFAKDSFVINGVADGQGGGYVQTGKISSLLGYSGENAHSDMLKDFSSGNHTLSVFYMERGAGESNCKIKFNFIQTSAAVPTNVYFDKLDENNSILAGAKFALYDSLDLKNVRYETVSTADSKNNVFFNEVEAGTYYLKEIEAPEGYVLDEEIYIVEVENGEAFIDSNGRFNTTAGKFSIKKRSDNSYITSVVNNPEGMDPSKAVVVNKTATLDKWDDRTYTITLDAFSNLEETITKTENATSDIVLVLDKSGSMGDKDSYLNVSKTYAELKNSEYHLSNSLRYYDGNTRLEIHDGKLCVHETSGWWLWSKDYYTEISDDTVVTYRETRFDYVRECATDFVKELASKSPESNIGIVSYSSDSTETGGVWTELAMTKVGGTNTKTIIKKIKSISDISGGTCPSRGLKRADSLLNAKPYNNDGLSKYIILFTDGEPTGDGYVWDDLEANTTKNEATKIKNKGITLYTLGFALTTKTKNWLKNDVASVDCAKTASNASELNVIFKEIQKAIATSSSVSGATVVDYIDSRFDLLDSNGGVITKEQIIENDGVITLDNGGTAKYDENKELVYVEWLNQEIPNPKKNNITWNKTIKIKAKASYLGGNVVYTNNVTSGVSFTCNNQEVVIGFPQPLVNVKINFGVNDAADEIFLGQSLKGYFVDKVKDMVCVDDFDSQNATLSYSWEQNGTEGSGSLEDFEKYIQKLKPEVDTDYKLSVSLIPTGKDTDKYSPKEVAEMMKNSKGELKIADTVTMVATYHVTVITGTLTIEKTATQSYLSDLKYTNEEKKLIDATQTVVFTVNRYAEDETNFTDDKVLQTVDVAVTVKDGVGSVTLKNLRAGIYEVKEMNSWSWKYECVGMEEKSLIKSMNDEKNDGITYIGKKFDENDSVMKNFQEFTFSYFNAIKDITNKKNIYSDTMNVLNVFLKKDNMFEAGNK